MSFISYLSNWLKDVAVLFILISIAELVMPKGNMKKYINMIIGLLIIFTIVNPLAKLLKVDFDLSKLVFNYSRENYTNSNSQLSIYEEQEKQVEKLYKEKIYKDINDLLIEETEYQVQDMKISLVDNSEQFGEIQDMSITLIDKNIENSIAIETLPITIDPVIISKDIVVEETESTEPAESTDFIKDLINTKYSIDKSKITINFYKRDR